MIEDNAQSELASISHSQEQVLNKLYVLLAEAASLADQLDPQLYTRLDQLVRRTGTNGDYTNAVAVVRGSLKQLLQEQLGEAVTEHIITGESGYQISFLLDYHETGQDASYLLSPILRPQQKVALLEESLSEYDAVIPAGTVGQYLQTTAYGGEWAVEFRNAPGGMGDLTAVVTSQVCSLSNLLPLEFNYDGDENDDEGNEITEGQA